MSLIFPVVRTLSLTHSAHNSITQEVVRWTQRWLKVPRQKRSLGWWVRWYMHLLDRQPPIQVLAEFEVGSEGRDPLQAGVLAMGLRFSCVAGGGGS